ncbi:MAG: heat-inducible transcriptional repressor HrcA [Mycoplasmoidaceae bacterium]|nr:heat-inducible transcriptional repressor HrcA [Mycoplasmoidaceae bacterium]
MKLTERQTEILKIIIDCYTFSAQPVSSKEIVNKYMTDLSSATIRNEMAALEKLGMLEKTHTSSGRVPSIKGYKFYEENILKPHVSSQIKNQLSKVFVDRNQSIDTVIDQSVSIMNEILKLPSVVTTFNSEDLLKRFDLIQLSNDTAMIILVTSNGMINKNTIRFDHPEQLEDISICIRVFNDRLVDTPLSKIQPKLNSIKEIIRSKVHEYEFCIQQIIKKIFQFNQMDIPKTNVYGTK